jgi:uncharacterized protein YbjT (DUF2867 family)
MKIVIIGGSGLIGKKLSALLTTAGHEVLPASPSTGVDTLTGAGLAEAFHGAHTVVDVSNSPSWEAADVLRFFETSASNIAAAEKAAGVQHHVALSVVGADRMTNVGYMPAKVAQERIIRNAGIPYSIVRATQFFEFVNAIADASTEGDTVHLPQAHFQPIAADDVAAALADAVAARPTNTIVDVAGPEKLTMAEFIQRSLDAKRDRRKVVADPRGRYYGAQIDDTSLTPISPNPHIAPTRYSAWLTTHAS